MDFHLYKATRADGTVYFFHHRSMEEAKAFASDAVNTANLFSRCMPRWCGVIGEPEIVEHDTGTQTEFAHHGSD